MPRLSKLMSHILMQTSSLWQQELQYCYRQAYVLCPGNIYDSIHFSPCNLNASRTKFPGLESI
jgi:hypothetical protein